jgi:glutathione S-transferase
MKLHYNLFSPNCRKVALLATYINANVEFITVNIPAGGTETPEFLTMNPNGLVPTLQDGDFALWESNAIMQYIAQKAGNTEVWPNDLKARSLVSQWQFWETNHFGRAVMMLGFENFMKKILVGEGPDESTVSEYMGYFRAHAKILNNHLSQSVYFVGSKPTLADFAVAGSMQFANRSDIPLNEFPNIVRWFEKIQSLDAWKKTELKLG